MAVERVGMVAPWRWLQQSVALLRRQPRAIAGGAALLVAIGLLPSMLQLLLLQAMPAQAGPIQALSFVLSLLVYPPAVGGYFRLLHAADGNASPQPGAVFAGFSDGALARRMVILNVLFVSLSLLAITGLAYTPGGEALAEFGRALATLQPGATALPPFPAGALPPLLAMLLVGVVLVSAQGLANAQAALRECAPLPALAAAFSAVWRNLGALLLCYLPLSLLVFLVGMLVALAVVLVSLLLGAVLGKAAAGGIVLLLGVLVAIGLYALLFGFFYYGWRELFDSAPAPPPMPHQIAA
ncbi:MAG: hypothetical protein ABI588_05885 [Arenimonas sp.]